MQFSLIVVAALATFTLASPAAERRQSHPSCREVFFPDQCAPNEIRCDGAGAISICCVQCT
ncbi:hypothetical protein BKA70DRAFT_1443591 [Coprinopsis sp. MPI-PUGE-AT-0042]|nr:hypothetical protein BKA70DRAFT_1443591 [Coprinopsis sp. MPI-PUGE-AT-0042]